MLMMHEIAEHFLWPALLNKRSGRDGTKTPQGGERALQWFC